MKPVVSIIAPLYNEQETIPLLKERLDTLMDKLDYPVEAVLINDGSKDDTPQMIASIAAADPRYTAVLLSRNFGHQKAVSAGMSVARGSEALFIIDGDLQDPPELLPDFLAELRSGYDVVYAVREKRKEGPLKKFAYWLFYRILKSIANIDLPIDSGDFCMISRRVADLMNNMPEESRYLRGMRSWIGFKQKAFHYERAKRIAGESKYSLKMLFNLAYNGIFNFSEFPIKLITRIGTLGVGFTIIYMMYYASLILFTDRVPPTGLTTTLFFILFFGSLNLVCIGVLGEYIVRIFFQAKGRPLFVIDQVIRKNNT